jgi:toxin ParE1/3/4
VIFRFHPEARVEHLDHVRYYEQIRSGLGAQYLSDFDGTMGRVCEAPHRFRIERTPNIRIISFEKFPYSVIFREVHGAVELLSVPHDRQRPAFWVERL